MLLALRKFFERLQIQVILRFPLTRVLLAKVARSGVQYNTFMHLLTGFLGVLMLPVAIVSSLIDKIRGRFVIGQVTMVITTRCNLKCKKCSSMMPLYKHPQDMAMADILQDIDLFLGAVDHVYAYQLLGGEPFLHKDIAQAIRKLLSSDKVSTVNIVTNGGVVPKEEALAAMKDTRVKVQISGYPPELVPRLPQFLKALDDNGIKYAISKDQKWKDLGDKTFIERTPAQKKELFSLCAFTLCNHLINGRYYICPVAADGMNSGIIPECTDDYVDIRELSSQDAREQLKRLVKKDYISACDYCEGNTFLAKTIPAAEQIR